MGATVFEKIIARKVPAVIVYEDDATCAFLDIAPNTPGHLLVVPKVVYENLLDVPEETWQAVMRTVRFLAPCVMRAVKADGINIKMNNGAAAGQEVPHLHVHLIPRFTNDGLTHWQGHTGAPVELEAVGERIRQTIRALHA